MNTVRRIRILGWAAVLACAVGSVHAVSLGKLRGAALLGKPLELHADVQWAADEDPSASCVAAEVLYGDAMVEASSVSVSIKALPQGAGGVVLSVRRPVDEPVVTVYLRMGCRTVVSRKYVLLSELLSETLPLVLPQGEVASGILPKAGATHSAVSTDMFGPRSTNTPSRPAAAASARKAKSDGVESSTVKSSEAATGAKAPVPPTPLAAPSPMAGVSKKTGSQGGGPRLKLTPLDLSQSWEPNLRLSMELSPTAAEPDPARRAQALAVWKALQASPEEILQEAAQRNALEKELAELTQQSRSNQQTITALTASLRQAQDSRMANPAIFVLLFLLVVSGAVLAWRLRSGAVRDMSEAAPWWAGGNKDASPPPPAQPSGPNSAAHSAQQGESVPTADVPLGVVSSGLPSLRPAAAGPTSVPPLGTTSGGPALAASSRVPFGHSDFVHSVTGAMRSINSQELLDVRQQAEFFLALGQHDEAANLLQSVLHQGGETNPHIYLDLLGLLHRLGRKGEFEQTRVAFQSLFTGLVPEFADYATAGKSLLDYPDIVDTVVASWSSRHCQEYVRQCLTRDESDSPESGFALEAFRELLLLHAILGQEDVRADHTGALRPPYRTLPAAEEKSGSRTTSAAWPRETPLDLDLS